MNAHDGSQASLVKPLQQLQLFPVEDPGFCIVEKSDENRSSLHFDLGRQAQGVVLPHALLETSKGAAFFGDAAVDTLGRRFIV